VSENEPSNRPQSDAGSPRGRPWQAAELVPNITRYLSRSATIALLLSPVGLVLLAVIRLLIISNYNTATALAIASSGGYVNTLFGTVIPMVPILLPYLTLVLLFTNRVILGILSAAATALISPTAVTKPAFLNFIKEAWHAIGTNNARVGLGIFAVLVGFLLLVQLGSRGLSVFSRSLATIFCIALVPVILLLYPFPTHNSYYAQLMRQPWLPAESITLRSGTSLTGYILSEDQEWVTILNDKTRRIFYYPPSQITKREVCQPARAPVAPPLISLVPPAGISVSRPPQCGLISHPRTAGPPVLPAGSKSSRH
jgi:hypothetical protein